MKPLILWPNNNLFFFFLNLILWIDCKSGHKPYISCQEWLFVWRKSTNQPIHLKIVSFSVLLKSLFKKKKERKRKTRQTGWRLLSAEAQGTPHLSRRQDGSHVSCVFCYSLHAISTLERTLWPLLQPLTPSTSPQTWHHPLLLFHQSATHLTRLCVAEGTTVQSGRQLQI